MPSKASCPPRGARRKLEARSSFERVACSWRLQAVRLRGNLSRPEQHERSHHPTRPTRRWRPPSGSAGLYPVPRRGPACRADSRPGLQPGRAQPDQQNPGNHPVDLQERGKAERSRLPRPGQSAGQRHPGTQGRPENHRAGAVPGHPGQARDTARRPAATGGAPGSAKSPKIHRLSAASTMRDKGAWYKDEWRKKVERVGNLNYPDDARRQQIYGSLRVLVSINRDGTLYEVQVLQSSGQPLLDQAALRIVRLAAPYAPFTGDLADIDRLEIIRTWRFERGDRLSSN